MQCRIISLITLLIALVGSCTAGPAKPQWPQKCRGKSYCPFKPKNYPQKEIDQVVKDMPLDFQQYIGVTNRDGSPSEKDVGDCGSFKLYKKLYMIKDHNDEARYVAQSENFTVIMQIEECRKPGRQITTRFLDNSRLQEEEVHCHETRLPLELPVLSLDGLSLESETPKGGVSVSCSTKLMRIVDGQ